MIWELINPSDATVFEANDAELAGLACALVGRGQYPAKSGDGKEEVPFLMFEKSVDAWFLEKFGRTLSQSIEMRKKELIVVLRSFTLGSPRDLTTYKLTLDFVPTNRQDDFKKRWKEIHRSSMNDICGYAWQCADQLEGKGKDAVPAPRSILGKVET